jgi:pimeloyl-ACP methyl ester carboxylesterase
MFSLGRVSVDVVERGAGAPLVLLHGIEGPEAQAVLIDLMAKEMRVIAPAHPGFGASPLPDWIDHVDDLVYLYLDLFAALKLKDILLVGSGLGGWIAAEIAVRTTERLARLVLIGAVGIKPGGRESRDIPDIYALPPEQVARLMYHDPSRAADFATLPDEAAERVARHRESAALYLWEPYMHNPKLPHRLHRIDIPTLFLRGGSDGVVSHTYAEAYCAAIPGARLETIPEAGHFPELEQPRAVAQRIVAFAGATV